MIERKYGIRIFVTVGVAVFNEKARKTEDSLSVIAKDALVPLYHKKGVPAQRSLPFC